MGVYGNGLFSPVPEGYSIFERASNLFGEENAFTFMITAKKANLGSLGPDNSEEPSIQPQPYCNTVKSIDVWHGDKFRKMDEVRDITLSVLEDYAENHVNEHFVGFVHFIEPDTQGHEYGECSPEYENAIIECDTRMGIILDTIAQLDVEVKLYITATHGFDEQSVDFPIRDAADQGFNHFTGTRIFLVTNDLYVIRPGSIYEIQPSLLSLYNMPSIHLQESLHRSKKLW
jgi:hypothetical protein